MIKPLKFLTFALFVSAGFYYAGQGGMTDELKVKQNYEKQKSKNQFFIENKGQWPEEVLFLTRIGGMDAWITKKGVVFDFYKLNKVKKSVPDNQKGIENPLKDVDDYTKAGHVVSMEHVNVNPKARGEGKGKQTAYYNYFLGNDPTKWASYVGLYDEAIVKDVYPGIDQRWYFDNGYLRFDYEVNPGADVSAIKIKLNGQNGFNIENNVLKFNTRFGDINISNLKVYQGNNTLNANMVKNNSGEIIFEVKNFDKSKKLVIDPLVFSTFLGGTNNDFVNDINYDNTGNIIICGNTTSSNFPTIIGSYDTSLGGTSDGFVSKLNSTGTGLIFSTFLGGSLGDGINSIIFDASNIVIAGVSGSADYPVSAFAYDPSHNGSNDIVITKINSSGSTLVQSTYVGGSSVDDGRKIFVNGTHYYVVGVTQSNDFPVSGYDVTYNGGQDVVLFRMNNNLTSMVASTYFGGSSTEFSDNFYMSSVSGGIYCVGITSSTNMPVTAGTYSTTYAGGVYDAFLFKIDFNLSSLMISTYLGKSNNDYGVGIYVNASQEPYVLGYTNSTNFPTTVGCYDSSHNGNNDLFLLKFNSTFNSILYSTFIGGTASDEARYLMSPDGNNFYIYGRTAGGGYPTTISAYDNTYNGGTYDLFLTKFDFSANNVVYSTYLGGNNYDDGYRFNYNTIPDQVCMVGYTQSSNFPTSPGVIQTTHANTSSLDGFITLLDISSTTCPSLTLNSGTITCLSHTVSVSNTFGNPIGTTYTWTGVGLVSGVNSETAQVHLPGIYTLAAQIGTCITTQTIYVPHDSSIPSLSLSVTNNLDCLGNNTASVIATGTVPPPGAATYTWAGPNIISGNGTQTIEVGAGGNYTCVVIPALNPACYNAATITVLGSTVAPTPTVTKSNDVNCYTNQVTLTVLPAGMSYTWTAPVNGTIISGANSQIAVVTVTGSGIFNINVEDPNAPGCIGTGGISVLTNTTPPTGTLTAPLGTIITCAQPTLNIIANTTPATATVSWSGPGIVSGGTTKTVVVNAAGIYTALITNTLNGCTATRTMQITGNTTPPSFVTFGATRTCANPNPTIGVQPNTPAFTYTWTAPPTATILTPANLATVAVNNAGNFTVVVTSTANGCSASSIVAVTNNTTPPSVSLSPSSFTICTAQTITLTGTPSGGVYSGSFVTGNLFTPTAAGIYTVAYTYTSPSNGCTNQAVQSLTANACAVGNDLCSGAYTLSVPSLTTGSTTGATTDSPPFCSYVGSPSGPGVWYAVNGTGGYIAANICSSNFPAQIYLYTGNCTQLINLTCAQNNSLSSLCGGASGAQVSWCSQVGVTYYLLVTTGSTPGNFTLNITSPVQPSITVSGTPSGTICSGNTATLSVTSAPFSTTFTWNPGSQFGPTYIVSPSVTTQYTVQSNSAVNQGVYGCVFSGVYTQSVVPFTGPSVSVSATPNPICQNNTATLSASGVTTYTWSTGHTVPTITQFYSSTGTYNYTVTGTNSSGCKSSAAVQVTVNPTPSFFVSGGNITCSTPQPTLFASNGSLSYTWTAPVSGSIVGSPNNSFVVVAAPGNYTALGVNSSGCSQTVMVSVGTSTTPPTVSLTVSQNTVCTSNSVVLSGSPFGGVYNAACCLSGNVLTPTAAGVYTVTYTYTNTSNGCTNQAVTTITAVPFAGPVVTASVNPNPVCQFNTATLSASGVSTYTWSTGHNTSSLTQNYSSTGLYNYTVIGTNSLGCNSSAALQVTVNTGSAFSISGSNITCYTSQPTLVASNAANGYTWYAPGTGTIIGSPLNYSVVVGGPGTYTAVSLNSSGCTFTNYYTVSTNTTPPSVSLSSSQSTVCTTNSVVLSGSPFGGVYSASCCLSGNVLTPTASGVYTVTYSYTNTSNGCTNQAVATVTAVPFAGPSVSVNAVQNPICAGNTATLIGSGVSSYTWNTGSNSATITPFLSSSGVYNYTVNGTNSSGCISSAAIQVTATTGSAFSINGSNITCYTSQPTLVASNASNSYTWYAPGTGSIIGSANNYSVVVGGPGTYTAISSNSAGCTYTNYYTVSTNTTPPSVNVTPSQNTVCVSNSVALNGTPFGGVYNAACCLSGNVLTPTAAGVYTVTYSYTNTVNGCTNQAITTVTANNFAGPSVSVSAVQNPICAGTTATLVGSGVSSYTWNTGSNSATINPFFSSSGTYNYTVSGTNGFGCVSSAALQMTVSPGAVFSISGNNITCATSQPTLYASNSSLSYTWNAPVTGSIVGSPNNSFVVVAAPGTYTASATNSAGCTYTTTYAVSINTTPPSVNLQPSQYTVCTTNSIQLFGSPSGGVYNAPCCLVGNIFTPTAAGVYTVSYSYTNSVNGCSNQAAITVTANTFAGPTVNVSALQNPICAGNNATLIGSGVSSYSWSNGSTSQTITPYHGSSGTYNYSVIGTNSLGCKSMASIQLTVNNTPFFTVNNTNIGCTTPNATLSASNGSYNYTWTAPPTGTIISGTNGSVAVVTGTGVYSVTASSGAGCTYSTIVSVSSTTSQAVSISGTSITCLTPTPVLFANPSGLNYTWTTSGGAIIGSVNNQSINVGAPGLYSVYVYNPSTGCYGSAQFTVGTNTITPVVSASAGGSLNCSNTSVALTGTSSVTSNVSYQWFGGVCGSSVTLNSTACNPGTYTLQVTNLINGCVGRATVQVVSDVNYISATVTPLDILDCNTNTVQVTVNTSTTVHQYNWTGPGIVSGQGSPTITVNAPGVYSVAVTNTVTGCTVGIQTVVIQTTSLFVNLTGTNTLCSGNSAVLVASGATSYTWSTGATTNSITVAPSTNTIYTVTGQDGSCTGSTLISISVLPSPTVTAVSSSATMSPGGSVQFTASGAINYTWSPSAGLSNPNVFNPIANPAQSTTYCVEGSNLNGCRDTACVRVQVRECGNLYVPNIFSPNGDGVNDYFCVMGWKCLKIKKFNMTIYNRWGEKVYESDYAGNCWNGIVEGEVVAGNSYVYHIYILEDNGTETVLTGDVTVVK